MEDRGLEPLTSCMPCKRRNRSATHVEAVAKASRDAGAIPAASTFSEHASTGDAGRHDASELPDRQTVASDDESSELRQGTSASGGSRPARATESATSWVTDDSDLADVVAAWAELPRTVRAGILAMVKAARN
jgi:hypothetical protein